MTPAHAEVAAEYWRNSTLTSGSLSTTRMSRFTVSAPIWLMMPQRAEG
jgi:hypothetical protein